MPEFYVTYLFRDFPGYKKDSIRRFSGLPEELIKVTQERRGVTVTLPDGRTEPFSPHTEAFLEALSEAGCKKVEPRYEEVAHANSPYYINGVECHGRIYKGRGIQFIFSPKNILEGNEMVEKIKKGMADNFGVKTVYECTYETRTVIGKRGRKGKKSH